MEMLPLKPLLLLSLVFMYLTNFLIKAQPIYPFTKCNNGSTYTPNSKYSKNLDDALYSLLATDSSNGYYNVSVGKGTDTANAMCLCRGDVEQHMCLSCLSDSIYRLRQTCPNQTEAVIYYEFCLLKYSNAPILGTNDMDRDIYFLENDITFPNTTEFDSFLQPFMNKLRGEAAAGGSFLKFAMDNTTGPRSLTLYGLAQCIPILTEAQCNECLKYAIAQMSIRFDGRVGAVVLMSRCNVRYEIFGYYIHPANLPSPPSLSLSGLHPSANVSSPPGTYDVSPKHYFI
ncbi:hypothetical protein L1987_82836 [Smallanthus sonchifolius]|uniref:Uncharacterized protein n=1 Tax=Smallanthus sonchifolius TaxID=185202 RepID=A0ACB8YBR1_9ASTR|nr:hypothetical protein L1987_82836 [Smallanthus sonchifolius]